MKLYFTLHGINQMITPKSGRHLACTWYKSSLQPFEIYELVRLIVTNTPDEVRFRKYEVKKL